MHAHFQFTFSGVCIYLQPRVQCNRGEREFTQIGSASELPCTERTQTSPDFIHKTQSWLTITVFCWICRIAGNNARHKPSVQEPFLEYQS